MAVLFAGGMLAADKTVKSTFTSATKPSAGTVVDLEKVVTWSITTEVGAGTPEITGGTASSVSCLKFGSSGSNYFKKIELSTDYYKKHNVKSVVAYIRNNGKKTGTFTAQQGSTTIGSESQEFGAEWKVLTANATKGAGGTLTVTYEVAQCSYLSYIEVVYEEGDAPACTNTVAITKGEEANGTFSLSATEVCGDGEGEDVLVTGITPAEGYEFGEITTSASGTVDNEGKKVTGITAATTISVVFKEIPKYTVSFSTGEGNPTVAAIAEEIGGKGIELPAGPAPVCSDWAFAGWAEAAVAAETTKAPELLRVGANYKPAADVTLYAVYKRIEKGDVATQDITETFESQEAGTVYNDTLDFAADASVAGLAWTMYFGTVSTNDKIAGNNSAQIRWYASSADVLGCIETKTALGGLDSVLFKMRVSNTAVKAAVWYSTDGEVWTLVDDTYACDATGSGGVKTFKAVIDGTPDKKYFVRIGVSSKGTAPSSSSYKLILDDIQFYFEDNVITSYYLSAPSCGSAKTQTLYCKMTQEWWTSDGAAVGIYAMDDAGEITAWPGARMEAVAGEEGLWKAEIDAKCNKVVFTRVSGSGDVAYWNAKTVDLDIPTDGKDLFTITGSAVWGEPGTTGVWSKYGEAPTIPVVTAFGSWNKWATALAFKLADDNKSASATLELDPETYNFKIKLDEDWRSNGYNYHRDFVGAAGITGNNGASTENPDGNMFIVADVKGEYVITWTFENDSIGIQFPEKAPKPKFYIAGNAALVGADKAWNPAAIAVMEESYTFENLPAGDYRMKVTLDGTWNEGKVKGVGNLTKRAEGIQDVNGNVGFTLAEPGNVTVTYNADKFEVEGKFVVSPIIKIFMASGDAWTADDESSAVYDATNGQIKVNIAQVKTALWQGQVHYQALVPSADKKYNLSFKMKANKTFDRIQVKYQDNAEMLYDKTVALEADVELEYSKTNLQGLVGNGVLVFDFAFAPAETEIVISDILIEEVGAPEPKLANGFYLISDKEEWKVENLSKDRMFVQNTEVLTLVEYMLSVNLEEGQEVKVVEVKDDAIINWFPKDGGNFVIDATFAGQKTIYFRTEASTGWSLFGGHIFMDPNTVRIDVTLPAGITWEDVYAYVWKVVNEQSVPWLAWPGIAALVPNSSSAPARVAMQKAEGAQFFFDCPLGYENIIFSGMNGSNREQTVDLQWSDSKKSFVLGAKDEQGHYKEKDSATAIDNTNAAIEAVKVLQNGQIFILKAGHIYNVTGQKVK